MRIETKHLKPGMILLEDVVGKSNKPMIEKNTVLNEQHILFLSKFLIESVAVSPLPRNLHAKEDNKQSKNTFLYEYEQLVKHYRKLYTNLQNNLPMDNLYEIRKKFIPFFEKVQEQSIDKFLFLINKKSPKEAMYYKSVAMSMLAVYIAKKLDYEKKDWLQIGFAALLSDCGFAKLPITVQNEQQIFRLHPLYSYKIVEHLTTLTKVSKAAILQHHERINGTGFPTGISIEKINPYARIIGVCDYFYQLKSGELSQIIHLLDAKKGVELDEQVIDFLIKELSKVQAPV